MPILPADYFSNWYVVSLDNKPRILQSYNEILSQSAENTKFIQGDIGSRIVNIGPKNYQATLNSPILIIDPETVEDTLYDIFDLVLENLLKIQQPISDLDISSFDYILSSASIQLSSDSSSINATIESWQPIGSAIAYNPENYNMIARQAKYYDIQFGMFGENYLISNGTLNISCNPVQTFYIPGTNSGLGNTTPLYAVNNYFINGNVNLIITPEQYNLLKLYNAQSPGIFNASKQPLYLRVLNRMQGVNKDRVLNLGEFMFLPSIDISLSAGQPTIANVNFSTMFRKTSQITID
jgi:hypothetical protein